MTGYQRAGLKQEKRSERERRDALMGRSAPVANVSRQLQQIGISVSSFITTARAKLSGIPINHLLLLFTLLLSSMPELQAAARELVTVKPLAQLAEFPPITASAEVITLNNSQLNAEVTAVILGLPVEIGQVVAPGTPLVLLEKTDLELALERAKATLNSLEASHALAQRQLTRTQSLAKKRLITEEILNQRETELKVSKAELAVQRITVKQQQRALEKTVIRAPFKAIVVERLGQVGELAMPGTPLIHILDAEQILVSAKLQPRDIFSLRNAATVVFIAENHPYSLKLHRVVPALDLRERSQEVRLRFTAAPALIGTTGDLVWRPKTPHLPADLLVRRGNKLGVFVLARERAKFVALADAHEGQPTKINLPGDTLIIIDGRFTLQDGEAVQVTNLAD
ncbi:efflux transporter, RND family, MFP subunit [Nitrosococcus oceani AFC27]|nr:efflux RND transporter periplasmic adaptor subunit [Nitrosococcus oceani]EDZ67693.1 efflux transporter, RND family, MFP subunit [Nitrosococcus oceani AFC27]KFI19056.1 hemolysin D [Nitrosococcus oceani C-27]GEM18849.1 hemolysin D [Nitrosococcus oceani]